MRDTSDYWTETQSNQTNQQLVGVKFQMLSFDRRFNRADLLGECQLSTTSANRRYQTESVQLQKSPSRYTTHHA